MSSEISLFSDGGSAGGSSAAGACIVDTGSKRIRALIYLGEGTNNEGEICGGLLGLSILHVLRVAEASSVRWVCDSEYVLKSATEYINNWQRNGWRTAAKKPVKNQGLWRAYLQLSSNFQIIPEHVRGHTGHHENEACDLAVGFGRERAAEVLEDSTAEIVEVDVGSYTESDWTLIDGRPYIKALRGSLELELDNNSAWSLVSSLQAHIDQ